jgi:hypothetical protein
MYYTNRSKKQNTALAANLKSNLWNWDGLLMCYAEREILNGMKFNSTKFDETHKTTYGIDFLHQLIVYVQFINVTFQFMYACIDTVIITISYIVLIYVWYHGGYLRITVTCHYFTKARLCSFSKITASHNSLWYQTRT